MSIVLGMARAKNEPVPDLEDNDDEIIDEQTRQLGLSFAALREKRGISKRALALRARVDPSHLGLFEKGRKRMRDENMAALAKILDGYLMLNDLREMGDVVGAISSTGVLEYQGDAVSFPALFEIPLDSSFGGFNRFKPGDRVLIVPCTDFEIGRFLLIESEGQHQLLQAVEREGSRGLMQADGKVFFYDPTVFAIVGMATTRHPAPEAV